MKEFMYVVHMFERSQPIWYLVLPLILMGLDVLTGFLNGWASHDVQSAKLRKGLTKKVGEVALLVICDLFSIILMLPKEVMAFFSLYIIVMELVSILENLDKMGVPIPGAVKKVINNAGQELTEKEAIGALGKAIAEESKDGEINEQNREGNSMDGEDGPRS